MPLIYETVEIKAPPEEVFDLISKVTDFEFYAGLIKEVRLLSGSTYRWTVGVGGVKLDWDAKITESKRPERFAWRSIRGIENRGEYELQATPEGTRVAFSMEYCLPNSLLEVVVAPLAEPLIRRASAEILSAVRAKLEHPDAGEGKV